MGVLQKVHCKYSRIVIENSDSSGPSQENNVVFITFFDKLLF